VSLTWKQNYLKTAEGVKNSQKEGQISLRLFFFSRLIAPNNLISTGNPPAVNHGIFHGVFDGISTV
jgi:hypothetical protein